MEEKIELKPSKLQIMCFSVLDNFILLLKSKPNQESMAFKRAIVLHTFPGKTEEDMAKYLANRIALLGDENQSILATDLYGVSSADLLDKYLIQALVFKLLDVVETFQNSDLTLADAIDSAFLVHRNDHGIEEGQTVTVGDLNNPKVLDINQYYQRLALNNLKQVQNLLYKIVFLTAFCESLKVENDLETTLNECYEILKQQGLNAEFLLNRELLENFLMPVYTRRKGEETRKSNPQDRLLGADNPTNSQKYYNQIVEQRQKKVNFTGFAEMAEFISNLGQTVTRSRLIRRLNRLRLSARS